MKLSYKYHTFCVSKRFVRFLKGHMRYLRAAGCIVSDAQGNCLLIVRNNRYDLPKGRVEEGETLLQAAIRETFEETGIRCVVAPDSNATKTYHIYNLYGGWHLKQTSWFHAHVDGVKPDGKPQHDEGITAVLWVTPDEWHRLLNHSYGTLRTLSKKTKF